HLHDLVEAVDERVGRHDLAERFTLGRELEQRLLHVGAEAQELAGPGRGAFIHRVLAVAARGDPQLAHADGLGERLPGELLLLLGLENARGHLLFGHADSPLWWCEPKLGLGSLLAMGSSSKETERVPSAQTSLSSAFPGSTSGVGFEGARSLATRAPPRPPFDRKSSRRVRSS